MYLSFPIHEKIYTDNALKNNNIIKLKERKEEIIIGRLVLIIDMVTRLAYLHNCQNITGRVLDERAGISTITITLRRNKGGRSVVFRRLIFTSVFAVWYRFGDI